MLLRTIFEQPLYPKPELGEPPAWLTKETPDSIFPLKEAVKRIGVSELNGMKNIAARDFVDAYIEAMKQFYVKTVDKDSYLANFTSMKEYRNVFLDHLRSFSSVDNFGSAMADEFERMFNAFYNAYTFEEQPRSCGEDEFDLFKVHLWELFVGTVTYMLHFELYNDIHELLVHTYFLRTSGLGEGRRPFSYAKFRFHSRMIEERIKPTLSSPLNRKYSLIGHYVCKEREYMPMYSGRAMANADLFLYQVFNGLELDELRDWYCTWFPMLYVYADEYDSIWKKLKSTQFCKKIMLVFGVKTIDDLKKRIANCEQDNKVHYSAGYPPAPAILTIVSLDEIATLP